MKENMYKYRVSLQSRIIALSLMLVSAGVVLYAAWEAKNLDFAAMMRGTDLVTEIPVANDLARGNVLFFSAIENGAENAMVYGRSLETNRFVDVFDYPSYLGYSPVFYGDAFVTLPGLETATSTSIPTLYTRQTGELVHLDTPDGYVQQHYRLEPAVDDSLAYMQLDTIITDTADFLTIDNWEIVIDGPTTTDTIIEKAMYPEWIAPGFLVYLRSSGLFLYNVRTGGEVAIELPYSTYSSANQYLVSVADPDVSRIVLMSSGNNQFAVLSGTPDDDDNFNATIEYIVEQPNTLFMQPVLSPDETMFAVVALVNTAETDTAQASINIYDFSTNNMLYKINLPQYDPESIVLHGWE